MVPNNARDLRAYYLNQLARIENVIFMVRVARKQSGDHRQPVDLLVKAHRIRLHLKALNP